MPGFPRPGIRRQMSDIRRGEWSELGSRDIDHTTRGARVRERDAIESIRPSVYATSFAKVTARQEGYDVTSWRIRCPKERRPSSRPRPS